MNYLRDNFNNVKKYLTDNTYKTTVDNNIKKLEKEIAEGSKGSEGRGMENALHFPVSEAHQRPLLIVKRSTYGIWKSIEDANATIGSAYFTGKIPKVYPDFGTLEFLPEIIPFIIDMNDVTFIKAGTGSGKSVEIVQAIQYFLKVRNHAAAEDRGKRIILTQPRVLNTVEIADFISLEAFNERGKIKYYTGTKVNDENTISNIVIMTEGALIQRFTADKKYFDDVYCVIFDEIHERSVDFDFCLGIMPKSLKKVLMSATFNEQIYIKYFNKNHGVPYDVMEYIEIPIRESGYTTEYNFLAEDTNNYLMECAKIIHNICNTDDNINDGQMHIANNIIVFLPTMSKINALKDILAEKVYQSPEDDKLRNITILELYSGIDEKRKKCSTEGLELGKYENGLKNAAGVPNRVERKVILATDVAETGVTLDRLKYVIDSGYRNAPYYDPYIDAESVELDIINRAKALQRWGRVGRTGNGVVYCLYTYDTFINDMAASGVLNVPSSISTTPLTDLVNTSAMPNIYRKNMDTFILRMINHDNNIMNIQLIDPLPMQVILRSYDNLYLAGVFYSEVERENSPADSKKLTNVGLYLSNMKYPILQSKFFMFAKELYDVGFQAAIIIEMIQHKPNTFVALDNKKLVDLFKLTDYKCDFVNLWLIYVQYKKKELDETNDTVMKFKDIEEQVKKLLQVDDLPDVDDFDLNKSVMNIIKAVRGAYRFNVLNKVPGERATYRCVKNKNITGQIKYSTAFRLSAKEDNVNARNILLPQTLVYDNITIVTSYDGTKSYNFNLISKY